MPHVLLFQINNELTTILLSIQRRKHFEYEQYRFVSLDFLKLFEIFCFGDYALKCNRQLLCVRQIMSNCVFLPHLVHKNQVEKQVDLNFSIIYEKHVWK